MKLCSLITFSLIALSANSFANSYTHSDGCYGDGVIAFDQELDSTGLYIISWGNPTGISKIARIELPPAYESGIQGIKCESDKISILRRGTSEQTAEVTKFTMHLTEISLTDGMNPKIIFDKPDHYQIWEKSITKHLEPLKKGGQISVLPEPNLKNGDCPSDVPLQSHDPAHSYYLIFDGSKSKSTVKNGYGTIYNRCETFLVMKDKTGRTVKKVKIRATETTETID